MNKLVPCAWLLSGALEVWSLRLRLATKSKTGIFGISPKEEPKFVTLKTGGHVIKVTTKVKLYEGNQLGFIHPALGYPANLKAILVSTGNGPSHCLNGHLGQDLGFGGFAFALKLPQWLNTNLALTVRANIFFP